MGNYSLFWFQHYKEHINMAAIRKQVKRSTATRAPAKKATAAKKSSAAAKKKPASKVIARTAAKKKPIAKVALPAAAKKPSSAPAKKAPATVSKDTCQEKCCFSLKVQN